MRVEIARIAAGEIPGRVNRNIEREPIALDQFPREARDQSNTFLGSEFGRQGHQVFACDPRIFSNFGPLCTVP
jgi:hypothetical protein